ncbi:hypothetical protein CB1_000074011 [Camelus ferus]|nr:hypothetical protein CB1_000074011 [Camelus ferus]
MERPLLPSWCVSSQQLRGSFQNGGDHCGRPGTSPRGLAAGPGCPGQKEVSGPGTEMTAEERKVIQRLDNCDFTEMHRYFADRTAARKGLSREEKQRLKEEAEKLQQEFGYCILDGHREKIGNFKTEPPGLFRGRGNHPEMGMLKRKVMLEGVTINCSGLVLRAGHEEEEGETADAVGCCSLCVEHVQLHLEADSCPYVVKFDFLGKDSIHYYN